MNVIFVLFPNVTQLDFTGPVQFLSKIPDVKLYIASKDGQAVPTDCGFAILPTHSFADCPTDLIDIIVLPGGGPGIRDAIVDETIIDFVKDVGSKAKWITSVCTGSFLLGAAGLLKGKRATTHWGYTHLLELYGAIYEPEKRIVVDGNVITAGGVTSGIDFALQLIAIVTGSTDIAQSIQLAYEYNPQPPFVGGTPSTAPSHIVQNLQTTYYTNAAKLLETVIQTQLTQQQHEH